VLYAVLLLGLLPLALFPDGSEVEPEEESGDNIADEIIAGPGDLLEETGDDPTDESADDTDSIVSANLSDDGEDTEIYLGNELVAVLRGVTDPTQVEITAAVDAAA
jgi:hypothetical protein